VVIKIKRVYDNPAKCDSHRVLIDRIWPRGLTKSDARIDEWLKQIAPSTGLRKWFKHFGCRRFGKTERPANNYKT
jgi:uncharacterized protein YeaO (DUF488 family)